MILNVPRLYRGSGPEWEPKQRGFGGGGGGGGGCVQISKCLQIQPLRYCNDLDGHDWKIQADVRAVVAKLRRSDVLLRLPPSA